MKALARVLGALAASLPGGSQVFAADRVETVKFAPGAVSATLRSSIRGDDGVTYRIATVAGQTMQILFAPSSRACAFNVYAPGAVVGREEAIFIGSTSGSEFALNPTAAGVYLAQVHQMRSAARRGAACRFKLSLEVTGPPGGVSAGVSTQAMIDACKGSAAVMYGVQPRQVSVRAKAATREGAGYRLDGVADKGAEGRKTLRCLYSADRTLARIQALTPDGE